MSQPRERTSDCWRQSPLAAPTRRVFPALLLALSWPLLPAAAEPQVIDDFDSLSAWTVIAADGVRATIAPDEGPHGPCLRLDFDFERGSGFCVVHRTVDLPLPPNYRFTFALRGDAPPNNLEFKLIDSSGQNVWWVNRRAFEFPTAWRTISYKARHFSFAWGPSGGAPLERVGAIEIAVAAASGGKGSVYIDRLTFEPLPQPVPTTQPTLVAVSTSARGPVPKELPPDGRIDWQSTPTDRAPTLTLDFQAMRELGGLAIDWGASRNASAFDVELSHDGHEWETAATVNDAAGPRNYVPLPDAEARYVRLVVRRAAQPDAGVVVDILRVMPIEFAASPNSIATTIAREAPRGWFPRYLLGLAPYWTIMGLPGGEHVALLDTDGAVEVERLGFRIEPFLYADGRLITWADVVTRPALLDEDLPIPSVTWETDFAASADGSTRPHDLELEVTALADGTVGDDHLLLRYQVRNRSDKARDVTLYTALRPYQVLPPWQELNITGGVAKVARIAQQGHEVTINGRQRVVAWTPADGFGAATFMQGDVARYLSKGELPPSHDVTDANEQASGAFQHKLHLAPQSKADVLFEVPWSRSASVAVATQRALDQAPVPAGEFERRLDAMRDFWRKLLGQTELELPPNAAPLVHSYRVTQAYMLINTNGPAIQPGSRTYARSWIRDGALISTALLNTGHTEPVRAFIDWFAGFQFDNGKIPCVVDRRGPDPVPEHDSTGEFLYLLHKYHRMTGDRELLARHWPRMVAAVNYLDSLRQTRLTPEYRDGPPEQRVCYGLLPESISHEGYSAKPMHSYWDDFFALRGIQDAADAAHVLGHAEMAERWGRMADEFRTTLAESIALALKLKHIDYVPGCAELGDFDATSTAIALFPCEAQGVTPDGALQRTFDKYWQFFCDRRDGKLTWDNYTPYELRIPGALVRLGQPERARAAFEFFLRDQRPPQWHAWAEVVWHDPDTPKFIGDMPHTWAAAEFLNSWRSLFVYECEADQSLVLLAGVDPKWAAAPEGIAIARWPTDYGPLSYTLRQDGNQVTLRIAEGLTWPPGGVALRPPWSRQAVRITVDGQPLDQGNDGRLRTPVREVVWTLAP